MPFDVREISFNFFLKLLTITLPIRKVNNFDIKYVDALMMKDLNYHPTLVLTIVQIRVIQVYQAVYGPTPPPYHPKKIKIQF